MTGPTISAGSFSIWLAELKAALDTGRATDVPCGECTACCSSRQFVPLAPDETEALRRIPAQLRFRAPHRPEGHYVLGFDESGRCPMLGENGCSIYEDRPRACRAYDCRIFTATGIHPGDGKQAVADRVARWRFDPPDSTEWDLELAVAAAGRFLDRHGDDLPEDLRPITATQRAVMAVEVCGLFARTRSAGVDDADATLRQVVAALRPRRT